MKNSGKDITSIVDKLNYVHSNIKELNSATIIWAGYLLNQQDMNMQDFIIAIKQIDMMWQSYLFSDKNIINEHMKVFINKENIEINEISLLHFWKMFNNSTFSI